MTQSDIRVVVNEFDLDALGDDWETLVSAGIQIVEAHDRNRWTLGDLAKSASAGMAVRRSRPMPLP